MKRKKAPKVSIRQIKEKMSKSNAISVALSNLLVPFFIKLFLFLKITPNQISVFNFLFVFIPAYLIGRGDYWLAVIGTFLLQFHIILDYSDGTVARLTNTVSKFGGYYECLFHNFVPPILMIALGFHSYMNFKHPVFLFLGGFTAFSMLFIQQLKLNKDREVLFYAAKENKRISLLEGKKKGDKKGISYYVMAFVRKINGFSYMMGALLILAVFGILKYAIIFYSFFYLVVAILKLFNELRKGFSGYSFH